MRTLGASHTGRVRSNNQDAFVCGMLTEKTAFAIVCDGMGGVNGGNIASSLALRCIADRVVDGYRESASTAAVRTLLENAIQEANEEVYHTAMNDVSLRGMGTTVVAAIVTPTEARIAHVGDSRAYWVTHGAIAQITRDHSVVQEMVEKGQITKEQARTHPQKHFLTRAIGVEPQAECEFTVTALTEPGTILICTDGLTNMVEDRTIQSLVRTFPFADVPMKLITTANLAGGSDNITVATVANHDENTGVKEHG